jgi:hypothetical protein
MTDFEKFKIVPWAIIASMITLATVSGLYYANRYVAAVELGARYEVCGPNNTIVLDKKTMECYVLDSDKMKFVEWRSLRK